MAASPRVAAYRDLTPHAVEPSQALVTLNGFVTLVTLGGAVPFHPEMMHYLRREGDGIQGGEQVRKEKHGAEKQDVYKGTSDTTIKESKRGRKQARGERQRVRGGGEERGQTNDAVCVFKARLASHRVVLIPLEEEKPSS